MKISEYTLLEDAFEASFGFMLNRIGEALDKDLWVEDEGLRETLAERCFHEFTIALEEMGVELGEVDAPLRSKWGRTS